MREQQLVRQLDLDFVAKFAEDPGLSPNLFYFLGDRYEFCRTWSAVSNSLPTFRKNTGRYLHRESMQLLLPREKLAALGWPMTEGVAKNLGTSIYPSHPDSASNQIDLMAGNAMHFSVASIVLMLGLCCHGPS